MDVTPVDFDIRTPYCLRVSRSKPVYLKALVAVAVTLIFPAGAGAQQPPVPSASSRTGRTPSNPELTQQLVDYIYQQVAAKLTQDQKERRNELDLLQTQIKGIAATNKSVRSKEAQEALDRTTDKVNYINTNSADVAGALATFRFVRDVLPELEGSAYDEVRSKATKTAGKIKEDVRRYLERRKEVLRKAEAAIEVEQKRAKRVLHIARTLAEANATEAGLLIDLTKELDLFQGEDPTQVFRVLLDAGGGVAALTGGIWMAADAENGDLQVNTSQALLLGSGVVALAAGAVWEILQQSEIVRSAANAIARNMAVTGAMREIRAEMQSVLKRQSECVIGLKEERDAAALADGLADCLEIMSLRVLAYRSGATELRDYLTAPTKAAITLDEGEQTTLVNIATRLEQTASELNLKYDATASDARQIAAELRDLRLTIPRLQNEIAQLEEIHRDIATQ